MLVDATQDIIIPILTVNPSTGAAVAADALPTFRVITGNGPVANGGGTAAVLETEAISAITTGATTTVTSAGHNLSTGAVVTISGAAGTTGVNGTHSITVVDANTFTFNDVSTSGTYTSGASWLTPGLYAVTLDSTLRSALEPGRNYALVCYAVIAGSVRTQDVRFQVAS